MASHDAVIVAGLRTAMGAMSGGLAAVPAPQLGATCIKGLVARTGMPADQVDEVVMGNCIAAGLGMNPARQAAIFGGLPPSSGATTVNRACASGMKAVIMAAQAIRLGDAGVVIAGGMESMTRAPYLLLKAREGYRMGNSELPDALIYDGLTDPFSNKHMGIFANRCAEKFGFSKQVQDDFAVCSHLRARKAIETGVSTDEIVPVEISVKGKTTSIATDEGPSRFDEAKLRSLKPAFGPEGTVTAGNASSINDGAAALLVASAARCQELGLKPLARIVAGVTFSREPEWFTIAPIGAVNKLLGKIGWSVADVDLFEVNEAFAAVGLAVEKELAIPADRLNIYGGAIALGHPIGCSGARILVTLLNGLRRTGGRRGVATLCVGGGEGIAMAVEMIG
jgi:acetyl-CoA C-acetyltransferase